MLRKALAGWLAIGAATCCVTSNVARATPVTSGNGKVVSLLYLDGINALAGTINGGLWRSADQGNNWTRVASIPLCSVKSLAKASNTQVFAASDCGLFKSTDGGQNWSSINSQPSSAVAVTAAATPIVLVGLPGAGILRSTDGGATFSDASGGLDSTDVRAISIDPNNNNNVYAALFNPDWYPSSHPGPALVLGGVFKSTNGGQTWAAVSATGLSSLWVTSVAVNNAGTVFATTAPPENPNSGTVQRLTNSSPGSWGSPTYTGFSGANTGCVCGGESLTIDSNGTDVWIGSSSLGPHLWVQSNNDLIRQMDGSFNQDADVLNKIGAIAGFSGSPTLLGSAGLGVYRSGTPTPGGLPSAGIKGWSPWLSPSADVQADRVLAYARNGNGDLFVGLADGGVVKQPNGSSTWSRFNTGFPITGGAANVYSTPTVQYLAATSAGDIFLSATALGGVMRSTGGTASWSALKSGGWQAAGLAPNPGANEVFASDFYGGSPPGVWRVPSSGAPTQVQGESGGGLGYISPSTSGNARVYALNYDGATNGNGTAGFVVQSNGTTSAMTAAYAGFQNLGFYAAADNGATVIAASLKGLFKSTDSGATFTRIATSGLPVSGIVGLTMNNNIYFAATREGDLLCSADGSTWQTKVAKFATTVGLVKDGSNVVMLSDGAGFNAIAATTCP